LQNGTASANQVLTNDSYNASTYAYTTQISPSVVPDTYFLTVDAIDNAGNRAVVSFNVSALQVMTGASGSSGTIDKTKPVLNYPNPWNPNASSQVAISYYLTDGVSATNVYIYNQIGELVHAIQVSGAGQNGTKAGYNRVLWDGKDQFGAVLSNGIYLYSIVTKGDAGTSVVRGKMAVLRR
jgi:flagellar hook assembly protein FlgD